MTDTDEVAQVFISMLVNLNDGTNGAMDGRPWPKRDLLQAAVVASRRPHKIIICASVLFFWRSVADQPP